MSKARDWKFEAIDAGREFLNRRKENGKSESIGRFMLKIKQRKAESLGVDLCDVPHKSKARGEPLYIQALRILAQVTRNRDITAQQYLALASCVERYLCLCSTALTKYYDIAILPVMACKNTQKQDMFFFCPRELNPVNLRLFAKQIKAQRAMHTRLLPNRMQDHLRETPHYVTTGAFYAG